MTPDPEVAAAVARYEAILIDKMSETIATTAVALDSSTATVRTREAAIGNLFADAMRAGTRADAAILNGGGIRAGKTYEPGARISQGDVLAELPFNNRVVVVEDQRRRAEERDRERAVAAAARERPLSAGLRHRGRRSIWRARPGNRITAMQVGGAPLDESRTYRVALLDYLARGGDDYTMFASANRITPDNDAPLLVNEVVEYLRRIGTARTGVEGRVVGK